MKQIKKLTVSKRYLAQYEKIVQTYPNKASKIADRIEIFFSNRQSAVIKDHPLGGFLQGYRAFWVGGDLRIIYTEYEDRFVFEMIGTHNQVY